MNTDLGTVFVALGLASALLAVCNQFYALISKKLVLLSRVKIPVLIMLVAAIGQVAVMERALITRDFTVAYVAQHGSTRTPPLVNVATLWSALEGSILLWVLILVGYLALVVWRFKSRLTDPLVAWAVAVMSIVCVFFFILLIGPAYPFGEFDPWPGFDGPGPNPLLQNHILMAFHPPILYLGYVGMTVPFSFAIAALITGRIGEGWLVQTRKWTLIAWGCLSLGIVLGSWWSYEILGWGGYWAWDRVENAAFLPWLTGTAFIHSVLVQERRGMLRVWNLSLLLATFALSIFGTFLTRSGVIDSVHEFSASSLGPLLLGFFAAIVLVSVGLVGWRGAQLRSPGSIDSPVSREGAFLGNNLLFTLMAFVILLGTLFPLVVEAINGDQLAVGRPYFDRMLLPIGVALLLVMGIAPLLTWRSTDTQVLGSRALFPAALGAGTMVFALWLGAEGLGPVLGLGLAGFVIGSSCRVLFLSSRRNGLKSLTGRAGGGMVAHIGVSLLAFGFIASTSFSEEGEFQLSPGEVGTVAGHEGSFVELEDVMEGPNRVVRAQIEVKGRGR